VVQGAVQGGLGVSEVVASLLDPTQPLTERGLGDVRVHIDPFILLRVTLPHCVFPTAIRQQVGGVQGGKQEG